jgi:hypothetical protein
LREDEERWPFGQAVHSTLWEWVALTCRCARLQ